MDLGEEEERRTAPTIPIPKLPLETIGSKTGGGGNGAQRGSVYVSDEKSIDTEHIFGMVESSPSS